MVLVVPVGMNWQGRSLDDFKGYYSYVAEENLFVVKACDELGIGRST